MASVFKAKGAGVFSLRPRLRLIPRGQEVRMRARAYLAGLRMA